MKTFKLDMASSAAFYLYATSAVITPVSLRMISGEFLLNYSASGGIETARTAVILLVLIVSGSIAKQKGKKLLLSSGLFILSTGMFLFSLSSSYLHIILSMMIIGIGGGLTEALVTPLVKDLHPFQTGKYLNITNAFYSMGITVSVLGFGFLLSAGYSWRLLFVLTGILAAGVGFLFIGSRFPVSLDAVEHTHTFREILGFRFFKSFALAMIFAGGIEAAFIYWLGQYIHANFGGNTGYSTTSIALFGGMMALGRFINGILASRYPMKKIITVSAVAGLGVSILVFTAANVRYFMIITAFAGLAAASLWPSIMAYASTVTGTGSTLLFVVLSGLGITGYGLTPLIIGITGDLMSLRVGLTIIPLWNILLFVVIYRVKTSA